MSITVSDFGKYYGHSVELYTLTNANGFTAEIITLGCIIKRLVYKGVDVMLGRDSVEEYADNVGRHGALIGRTANRIENAEFELNGKKYTLSKNNLDKNNIHGGDIGFDKKVWSAQPSDGDEPSLALCYTSPDGEEGFPGELKVTVTYKLTADNAIEIHYEAVSDADTVVNLTNHSYFNLNGHMSGDITNHYLKADWEFYTPTTAEGIPTGEVLSVKGTPFDFSVGDSLSGRISSSHPQIVQAGGLDHNMVLRGKGYDKVAELKGDQTGIIMEVYTDAPGVQIYTANATGSDRVCKDGAVYANHCGICFETQSFPNSMNCPHFPTAVLRKGEKYDTRTAYRFI